ncbi:MAG: hypothetical protein B5M55_07090 [Desulfococcus sp. 4484_242]|nr:MAG: hypothetical protein B5M55_07090 [Desulfococcus sp. 4484_242]
MLNGMMFRRREAKGMDIQLIIPESWHRGGGDTGKKIDAPAIMGTMNRGNPETGPHGTAFQLSWI